MKEEGVIIDVSLVRRLIASQFPQWKELSTDPVATSGWGNRTFHLGKDLSVRLPSAAVSRIKEIVIEIMDFFDA